MIPAPEPSKTYAATHIAAALIEAGHPELAQHTFMNRGGFPSMRWCAMGRTPKFSDIEIVSKAFRLWYDRFRPEHVWYSFDPEDWMRALIRGLPHHPKNCPHCGGRPYNSRTGPVVR